MVVDRFKKKRSTLSHCFTFIPKTGMGLIMTGVCLYYAGSSKRLFLCLRQIFSPKIVFKDTEIILQNVA